MYLRVQSSARGQIDGCSRASPAGLDDCKTSRHPALLEPLPPYLPFETFRLLRTDPMAPHLGCDRGRGPRLRPLPRRPGQARPGHPRTPLPTAGRKGRRERRALRGAGGPWSAQTSRLRKPPTATTAKTPTETPLPQGPRDPGPPLTCLLLWLPLSQRLLRLQLRPRRSWAHPAGDFETSVAPAPPRCWGGKPRPRGGNRRKWPWEG